nr:MAG TPA: hypothetical protein [Herelleviridae sp.]
MICGESRKNIKYKYMVIVSLSISPTKGVISSQLYLIYLFY